MPSKCISNTFEKQNLLMKENLCWYRSKFQLVKACGYVLLVDRRSPSVRSISTGLCHWQILSIYIGHKSCMQSYWKQQIRSTEMIKSKLVKHNLNLLIVKKIKTTQSVKWFIIMKDQKTYLFFHKKGNHF